MEGKIYCIKCLTTNQNYIGSTLLPLLVQRLAYHIQDYNKWKKNNSKSYLSSFKILENNNYSTNKRQFNPRLPPYNFVNKTREATVPVDLNNKNDFPSLLDNKG
jgi:hypothetical protein